MTEPQKTDAELIAELPLLVRDIVERSNWRVQLRKIVTERHLRVDQGAFLEAAVLRFITGNQSAEEMAAGVMGELKLDPENLQTLFAQLDREISPPMKVDQEKSLADGDDLEDTPRAAPAAGAAPRPHQAPRPPTIPAVSIPATKAGPVPDDLEAMINAGDDLLAAAVKPAAAGAPRLATPAAPAASAAAADAKLTADPLARARKKLTAPVVRPAEVSSPTPAKPAAPTGSGAPAASKDPYREAIK